jgi:predicted ArsR family transcriptional regulator
MAAGTVVSAMQGLRGEILVSLKKAQPLTAKELAERFGLTPNGLRRYLKELEDGGLVRSERVTRGVGGPSYAFTLTGAADALFPDDYAAALADALSALHEEAGSDAVRGVFDKRWRERVQSHSDTLDRAEPAMRGRAVAALLSDAGYMAEWQDSADGGTLIARHCAVRAAAERFPEACEAEARMLSAVLGATVERQACITLGCSACAYRVRFDTDRSALGRDSRWMDEEKA